MHKVSSVHATADIASVSGISILGKDHYSQLQLESIPQKVAVWKEIVEFPNSIFAIEP